LLRALRDIAGWPERVRVYRRLDDRRPALAYRRACRLVRRCLGAFAVEVDRVSWRIHAGPMASFERVQWALAPATGLSKEEGEELVAELIVSLERDREPEPGYDRAWSKEIRRRDCRRGSVNEHDK
jgi:hypothetical protein